MLPSLGRGPFDNDQVGVGAGVSDRLGGLIFGTAIARQRGVAVLELDHDVALARRAFHRFMPAAAHDKPGAEFLEGRLAHYKQVRVLETVDEIPKSASGKILRRLLRDQLSA